MSVWSRIILVVFVIGIVLFALAQYPDPGQWLKDYKDQISSAGSLVAIAAVLVALVRWIFVGKAKPAKTDKDIPQGKGDTHMTFTAGGDIIGRDKSENHYYHSKENKQANKQDNN